MTAKTGDTVFVHYVGMLKNGVEFDSSRGREPLEFVLGSGTIIPGFETAVTGREVGDKISVSICPEDAYGQRDEEIVLVVPRSDVPANISPEVGLMVQLSLAKGELDAVISRVTEDEVELDGNHPLAGQDLHFDIEIVKIKAA